MMNPTIAVDRSMLVDTAWLRAHLDDPAVRVVEVDVNPKAYEEWHLAGAALWNIYADLKTADYRTIGPDEFAALRARTGLDSDTTVVFYGYGPALALWLAESYGYSGARILDGSRDTLRAAGLSLASGAAPMTVEPVSASHLLPAPHADIRADLGRVQAAIDDPTTTVLDMRSTAEYDGERFWPSGGQEPGGRAGHIPGAVHLPLDQMVDGLYDERGAFRSTEDLRATFDAVDLDGDGPLITYCTIGNRAAIAWFVLHHLLGRGDVRVYDGSWAEWGRLPDAPVHPHHAIQEVRIMSGLIRKSLDDPEEIRPFTADSGRLELVNLESGAVGRATFQPGWRWSTNVRPIAGTDSCQAAHTCYFVSGRMGVVMTDTGEQVEYGPGDFAIMAPGHDAWTIGDEPCVVVDWQGFADYAKPVG